MEKTIVTTGKTIELAVEEALTRLGLDRDSVSVTVLAQAKSGFLGFGAQPAKVQVTYEVPDEVPAPKAAPSALSAASRSSKSPAEALRKGVSQPPKAEKAPEAPKAEAPKDEKKPKKKKEKTYTLTREQMEKAELAAKQLASVTDQFTRLTAEYDNYRKRTAKEKETIYQDAKVDTVKAFLAVYDNLERAVATDADPDSPHRKGLELIFSQFKEILKKLGVEEMEALGQPFDPQRHNAVMHIESEDLGENVVSQVFQAGFTLDGKVVRFAIVQVAN